LPATGVVGRITAVPVAAAGSAQLAFTVDGHGPPALLLHAGVTDARSWAPLVEVLRPTVRTIAYDRRGFGRTTYEEEEHDPVDDALAVLAAVGLAADEPVTLVGASNGGQVAIDLALAHPERVRALVLIGSAVSGAPEEDPAAFSQPVRSLIAAYETADEAGDLEALNEVEAHAWLDGWSAAPGRVGPPARPLFLDMNRIALEAAPTGPERPRPPAWDRLHHITAPTLVLCGDLDDVSQPTSEHLAAHIPGARHHLLDGTAHLPHLEGHPSCARHIADFVHAVG
jgi:pimeloyl-ACP methyl ester carboxylesterase